MPLIVQMAQSEHMYHCINSNKKLQIDENY